MTRVAVHEVDEAASVGHFAADGVDSGHAGSHLEPGPLGLQQDLLGRRDLAGHRGQRIILVIDRLERLAVDQCRPLGPFGLVGVAEDAAGAVRQGQMQHASELGPRSDCASRARGSPR